MTIDVIQRSSAQNCALPVSDAISSLNLKAPPPDGLMVFLTQAVSAIDKALTLALQASAPALPPPTVHSPATTPLPFASLQSPPFSAPLKPSPANTIRLLHPTPVPFDHPTFAPVKRERPSYAAAVAAIASAKAAAAQLLSGGVNASAKAAASQPLSGGVNASAKAAASQPLSGGVNASAKAAAAQLLSGGVNASAKAAASQPLSGGVNAPAKPVQAAAQTISAAAPRPCAHNCNDKGRCAHKCCKRVATQRVAAAASQHVSGGVNAPAEAAATQPLSGSANATAKAVAAQPLSGGVNATAKAPASQPLSGGCNATAKTAAAQTDSATANAPATTPNRRQRRAAAAAARTRGGASPQPPRFGDYKAPPITITGGHYEPLSSAEPPSPAAAPDAPATHPTHTHDTSKHDTRDARTGDAMQQPNGRITENTTPSAVAAAAPSAAPPTTQHTAHTAHAHATHTTQHAPDTKQQQNGLTSLNQPIPSAATTVQPVTPLTPDQSVDPFRFLETRDAVTNAFLSLKCPESDPDFDPDLYVWDHNIDPLSILIAAFEGSLPNHQPLISHITSLLSTDPATANTTAVSFVDHIQTLHRVDES